LKLIVFEKNKNKVEEFPSLAKQAPYLVEPFSFSVPN
jgi:hypothetical protein